MEFVCYEVMRYACFFMHPIGAAAAATATAIADSFFTVIRAGCSSGGMVAPGANEWKSKR